jgi:hypothetical protein
MKMTRATNRYFMRGGLLLAGLPGGGVSQRGGGVSGERVAVTEAGDRDVEARQPAERGGGPGAVDVEHAAHDGHGHGAVAEGELVAAGEFAVG